MLLQTLSLSLSKKKQKKTLNSLDSKKKKKAPIRLPLDLLLKQLHTEK